MHNVLLFIWFLSCIHIILEVISSIHLCPALLLLSKSMYYFLNLQLGDMFTGYTVAFVGFINGWDRSTASPLSTWWVPHFQHRKPIISLGQHLPSGHSTTCSKHARCAKALPISCPPCSFRTLIWLNFYWGIYSHRMSGRLCKDLGETIKFWKPIKQPRNSCR